MAVYKLDEMMGRVVKEITKVDNVELYFHFVDGDTLKMHHVHECYESVWLEDINGDMDDLLDSPILMSEKVIEYYTTDESLCTSTWTFYKFATVKGTVVLRWCGESNGYYSERVYAEIIAKGEVADDY